MRAATETATPRLRAWAERRPSVRRGRDPWGEQPHALAGPYGLGRGGTA